MSDLQKLIEFRDSYPSDSNEWFALEAFRILLASDQHEWIDGDFEWPVCRRCGVVKRADGLNKPCRGQTPAITLRGDQPPAAPDADLDALVAQLRERLSEAESHHRWCKAESQHPNDITDAADDERFLSDALSALTAARTARRCSVSRSQSDQPPADANLDALVAEGMRIIREPFGCTNPGTGTCFEARPSDMASWCYRCVAAALVDALRAARTAQVQADEQNAWWLEQRDIWDEMLAAAKAKLAAAEQELSTSRDVLGRDLRIASDRVLALELEAQDLRAKLAATEQQRDEARALLQKYMMKVLVNEGETYAQHYYSELDPITDEEQAILVACDREARRRYRERR